MAKPTMKVDEYWRQNNLESLFKDLTHVLVQRMPTDPVATIVQHLQKKYPKSFKTTPDSTPRTKTNVLQSQSFVSQPSDTLNNSQVVSDFQRQTSGVSQRSDSINIATTGSAFADLLKKTKGDSVEGAPALDLKNLMLANRVGQQVVRLAKNIRSDRDILEEELIQPMKTKENLPIKTDDQIETQTHEEPSVKQLIKYKQHIHLENDRRLHREHLASLATAAREKENVLLPDVSKMPIEVPQEGEKMPANPSSESVVPATGNIQKIIRSIGTSKHEEEILNDENIFQPRRHRGRMRTKRSMSRSASPSGQKQFLGDLTKSVRRNLSAAPPMMQFGVCKVCGNALEKVGDLENSALPSSSQQQSSTHSDESMSGDVDDWFESASQVSSSREIQPWKPNELVPAPSNTNPFQQNFFKPIKENNNILRDRLARPPIIIADDDDANVMKSRSPRMSESDVFVRTPSPPRRSSFSRNIQSPPTTNNQQPSNNSNENFFS